jgi:pimeloyl-ACP methyl ester carboxylesterase
MAYIDIAGAPHYYEWITTESGKGPSGGKPVMVFVHGWGGSARYWETTARSLVETYDCLLYDLRGFGRSSARAHGDRHNPYPDPRAPIYRMETYAAELLALIDALQLDRVSINAHSMGASIATLFVSQSPDRVERAILTCSGVFTYNRLTFTLFHQVGGAVVRFRPGWFLAIPGVDRLFMARFVHKALPSIHSRAFLADYYQADSAANLGTMYTCVSEEASIAMPAAFSAVAVPTLLIAGEKDIIIPPQLGQSAAKLNDRVEYVEIPSAAHFPMLEQPETYLSVVREFLERDRSDLAIAQ